MLHLTGGSKQLINTWVSLKALREQLHCHLPVELIFFGSDEMPPSIQQLFQASFILLAELLLLQTMPCPAVLTSHAQALPGIRSKDSGLSHRGLLLTAQPQVWDGDHARCWAMHPLQTGCGAPVYPRCCTHVAQLWQ